MYYIAMRGRGIEETAAVRWKRQQLDGKVMKEGTLGMHACMGNTLFISLPAV